MLLRITPSAVPLVFSSWNMINWILAIAITAIIILPIDMSLPCVTIK